VSIKLNIYLGRRFALKTMVVVIIGISGYTTVGKLIHWWVLVELTIGRPTSADGVKRLKVNLFI